jgi:serine O-acetyltransferase
MDPFIKRLYRTHQAFPFGLHHGEVTSFFDSMLGILFPSLCSVTFENEESFSAHITKIRSQLTEIIRYSQVHNGQEPNQLADKFFQQLNFVYDYLLEDAVAMFESDPAAKSTEEVIHTYPGFYAIAAYRIAHALHLLSLQSVPRIITEYAHGKTGIDIHPGASIGRHFSIDHGTGVVIGETTIIGTHVKLYQGVTLGALSVDKKDATRKRHPTLEDRVIVYAGATILGGQTTIGHDSIIGGNVWLTNSVPANSKIYYQAKTEQDDHEAKDEVIIKPKAK